MALTAALEFLRPHPHRGDLLAAGAVPLAVAALVIDLRMTQWGVGGRFVVVAAVAGLLLTMAFLAPMERDTPRAYHSLLLVAALLPTIVALQLLAELLGAHRAPGAGANAWTFGAEAGVAATAAQRTNSAICTLIAALAAFVAVEAVAAFVFHPTSPGLFRFMAVVVTLAFAAGTVAMRDKRRRHAVQLANAAGAVTVTIGLTYLAQTIVSGAVVAAGTAGLTAHGAPSAGWELYLLLLGFGLVGYGSVDYEPGPAGLGVLVLAVFALLVGLPVSGHRSLLGWPLFLLAIGAVGMVLGLRPRRPLPPSPEPATAAPAVPLRSLHDDDRT